MTTTMLIISLLLAVAFVAAATWIRGELPDSVSAMVYDLPKKGRWLWIGWMFVTTILMTPALMDAMTGDFQFIAFFTILCLLFTGALPLVEKEKNTAHYIVGIAACVLSQVCVLIISPWWLMAWLLFVAALVVAAFPDKPWAAKIIRIIHGKGVFLAEVVCAIAVYGALLT